MNKFKILIKKIKWKFQRAKRGFSDCDSRNIDIWFLHTMKPLLEHFSEDLHSVPVLPVLDGRTIESCQEEWKQIIERMIFLLGEMDEDTCSYENKYQEEFEQLLSWKHFSERSKDEEENKLIKLYIGEEKNKFQYMNLCKEEFFNLFSKYFYDLWD